MLWLITAVLLTAPASELSLAAMKGDVEKVELLLADGADVNGAQGDGSTALHWAAYREDAELVRRLLEAGADVTKRTRVGEMTPLFMAAQSGSGPAVELLLEAGADAGLASTNGTTPLMVAAASGSVAAVGPLLDHGVDPNAVDVNHGQTALMFAAASGRIDVMRLLAARGAEVGDTSLVPDPRKVEGDGGPKWRKGDIALGGMAPLHFTAREGNIEAAQTLLDLGADVNQLTSSNGSSALLIAIFNAHFDFAMFLLSNGADPKPAATSDGLTPLYAAIDSQWANRVWYPVPTTDEQHATHLELMRELIAKGADVDARLQAKLWQRQMHGDWVDPAGATAFWRAAQANDVPAMRLLVEAGANPSIATKKGCSPLLVACGYGLEPQTSTFVPGARFDAVRYLVEELGADVNAPNKAGYTPLHGAALTAQNDLLEYLLAMGGNVNARASMILGGPEDPDEEVQPGTGDTVADMANGPKPHNLVHPESLALLEHFGSENSNNCRASTCFNNAKKDSKKK